MGAFRSSMTAEVDHRQRHTHKAAGTVFGQRHAAAGAARRLPAGGLSRRLLLVFTHHDVPGIIGSVGTFLASTVSTSPRWRSAGPAPGGEAVGVLNLDGEPPAAALEAVRRLPAITSAVVVQLPPAGDLPRWVQG